jgi:hypothetical protein
MKQSKPLLHPRRVKCEVGRPPWTTHATSSVNRRRTTNACRRGALLAVSMLLMANVSLHHAVSALSSAAAQHEEDPTITSQLFEPSEEIRVAGPTAFPKPTAPLGANAAVMVEPSYGAHHRENDAILAYAEGYSLSYYMMFLETLEQTGYRGDVVLAIAESKLIDKHAELYLKEYATNNRSSSANKPNLVLYQVPLDCDNPDGTRSRSKDPRGEQLDVFQMCRLSNVYGIPTSKENFVPQPDPREGRVVATLRYEWYWIWSRHYRSTSWIMLLDARDSFFQGNPFANVPRRKDKQGTAQTGGLLYLFGENHVATRLGRSTKNLKWLQGAYGRRVLNALKNKPTICSGSTMGEQLAIETYLRAMVNEHDECDIRMAGSDQGFHNYLYYSGKLAAATDTIRHIVVWEQGKGIINNLGALRIKKLSEWGAYNLTDHRVLQWDGTLSPVAHQFDRDHDLFHAMMDRHRQWTKEWAVSQLRSP